MSYNYNGFNPIQARMDSLMQQKQMIEQQLQSLQGMGNIPPININNNMAPAPTSQSYDFNGVWVDGKDQARKLADGNKPIVMFHNNEPIFYMGMPDGTFKEYKYEEVVSSEPVNTEVESRINNLESKLDTLINALSEKKEPTVPAPAETPVETKPAANRGGRKNGESS